MVLVISSWNRSASVLICIAFTVFALWLIREVLPVIAIAVIYAVVTWPLVVRMERRMPRAAAILCVDLTVAAVAFIAVLALAPTLYAQMQSLAVSVPQALTRVLDALPAGVQTVIGSAGRDFDAGIATALSSGLRASVSLFRSATAILAALVVIPVLAAYFQLDQERYNERIMRMLSAAQQERLHIAVAASVPAIGAFVRGQLIVSSIVGILVYVVLSIGHVPFAGGIAVLTAIFDLVPYLGGVAAFVPSLLFALTANGPANAVIVGVLLVVVFELEAQLLGPQIVGSKTRLPPSLIVLALLVGGALFGVLGLFLAVPFAAAAVAVSDAFGARAIAR